MDQPNSPTLLKSIPSQIVNEGASFGPLNLNDFIDTFGSNVRFQAVLSTGNSLPKGLICTQDGIISGIAGQGTAGSYEVIVTAENDSSIPFATQFLFTIKPGLAVEKAEFFDGVKAQVWEALLKDLPVPDLGDILNRPISAVEIFYLLQRFAVLTIWDVYNLEMPAEKKLLQLEDMSPHYNIYDRGSCIVGAPKDLFNHERTLEDALQTARVMAREVYKRNWTVELSGFNKMIRGSWCEFQLLGDKHGSHLDILRYDPTADDMKIYTEKASAMTHRI